MTDLPPNIGNIVREFLDGMPRNHKDTDIITEREAHILGWDVRADQDEERDQGLKDPDQEYLDEVERAEMRDECEMNQLN